MRREEATPGAVAVEQHLDHHPGVIGRPAPPFLFVAVRDGRQIQLVHHVGNEVGQVVRRQPFLQGRRQQQLLLRIVGKVSLAHRHLPSLEAPAIILPPPHQRCFSDGLLVAISQTGRAIHPQDSAILDCRTCRTREPLPGASPEDIPYHDESHRWVIYLPISEPETGISYDLTITPPITITQKGFTDELNQRIQEKSRIIAKQGVGKNNWVIVLSQGFPVDPQWYDDLPEEWPANIDGIVIVATQMYLGAHHDLLPYNDLTLVLLKCPFGNSGHRCYHPSYGYRIAKLDQALNPISPDTHSVEELSYPTFNYLWPPNPVKRTLVLRDEKENPLGRYEDVIITPPQIKQALAELGYEWRTQGLTSGPTALK